MRFVLGVEYNGCHYSGWQRQKDQTSVQQTLELALAKVADEQSVRVTCAGRTDAGVHALQQVVHFDSKAERNEQAWVAGTNSNLPADIRVLWAKSVTDDFDARRSALARHYRYLLLNRSVRPALQTSQLGWCHQQLDEKKMQQGANFLLGEHDFTSFRGSGCQSKSPIRRVERIEIKRYGQLISIEVVANAFLLHMVRNIVGVLMSIGSSEQKPGWAREVLQLRDRRCAGITAQAQGLSLVQVNYPEHFMLPVGETPWVVLQSIDEQSRNNAHPC